MGRPEITAELGRMLEKYIHAGDPRVYWAREVTFDYATDHAVRVDYMKFKPLSNKVSGIEKGDFYCYEIKSSEADFKSKNGHNFLGDYNYYVMPSEEVYEKLKCMIPCFVGVLVPDKWEIGLVSVRKTHRVPRERSVSEMLLMMYRSFARDEHRDDGQRREDGTYD